MSTVFHPARATELLRTEPRQPKGTRLPIDAELHILRGELDAFYALLYGMPRDGWHSIIGPSDVMVPDDSSESFRMIKNNEIGQPGEFHIQRFRLQAWDRLFGL